MVTYWDDVNDDMDLFDGRSDTTIAWRDFDNRTGTPKRWSKLHKTADGGKTTKCGQTVPYSYDTDPHANTDRCTKCFPKRVAK